MSVFLLELPDGGSDLGGVERLVETFDLSALFLQRDQAFEETDCLSVSAGVLEAGSVVDHLLVVDREISRGLQGGYGISFCKEGINLDTVVQFKQLYDWLDWTDLRSCGAAYITPGHEGRYGDGNVLCSRLAQAIGAPVRASTATQHYDESTMDFTAWEGTVLTYGPKGNVIKVENNPKK